MSPQPAAPRSFITLLLLMHGFCILAVLSANLSPSPLQSRLVRLLAPYVGTLNFDPNYTRYHLTHGHEEHDDHRIRVTTTRLTPVETPDTSNAGGDTSYELPDVGWRGSLRRHRYQILGARMAFFANREMDAIPSEYAQAIGAHFIAQTQAERFVVECRMQRAPFREAAPLPDTAQAEVSGVEVFTADVWRAADGTVQVLRRSSDRESAPAISREVRQP